jgi:long-chain acyl-CoA synthetase
VTRRPGPAGDIDPAARGFATLSELVKEHAIERGDHPALIQDDLALSYRDLDSRADRIAAALQRDALAPGTPVAIVAATSLDYVALLVGTLRAGAVPTPIAPSSTAVGMAAMIADAGASHLFAYAPALAKLDVAGLAPAARCVAIDGADGAEAFEAWLGAADRGPRAVHCRPEDPFNIIYSSGTTGTPKGIVHSHAMRWAHIVRGLMVGFTPDAVTLVSTPLYSNTTLVALLPALAHGGTIVLMAKFDAGLFLALAARHRVTHAALVPVQYRRILDHPHFDRTDLTSFRMKTSTSAPFAAATKAEVLRRWPGGLTEIYGMTEGGGTATLAAHLFPEKLHTVGKPVEGHDIRIIDDAGNEAERGAMGEVVGRSPSMMTGYHNQPDKTRDALWFDREGRRYIRTGDIGRFDEDGFLVLMDRKKDMIISGGFNVYPSDIEAVLATHPDVLEAAVVGMPSADWGETPVAFVVLAGGASVRADELREWVGSRVSSTQRLHSVILTDALPRGAIGKILKRALRDAFLASS